LLSARNLDRRIKEYNDLGRKWLKVCQRGKEMMPFYQRCGGGDVSTGIQSLIFGSVEATEMIRKRLYWENVNWWAQLTTLIGDCLTLVVMGKSSRLADVKDRVYRLLTKIVMLRYRRTLIYTARYEAQGLGNISRNELKSSINVLIRYAKWFESLTVESQLDEFMVQAEEREKYESKWVQNQMNKVEEGLSGEIKRKKLETLKLIDKMAYGDLDLLNKRRKYHKFIK
jgi:hypothetical protein